MEPQDGTQYDGVVTVVRPLYLSDKTDWGLLLAADENGEPVKLAGATLSRYAEEGRTLHVRARWRHRPKYGLQLEVWRVSPHIQPSMPPTDAYSLLRRVPHVGEKRALLLVDRYGPEAVRKIDENPRHAFSRVLRMPFQQAVEAERWWRSQRSHPAARQLARR